jgi:hypothetical protein
MSSNLDDGFDDPPPHYIVEARAAVRSPATLLIVVGMMSLVLAFVGLIQINS